MAGMALIGLLVLVAFVPSSEAGGLSLRRANILSELLIFDDDRVPPADEEPAGEVDAEPVDWERIGKELARQRDSVQQPVQTLPAEARQRFEWRPGETVAELLAAGSTPDDEAADTASEQQPAGNDLPPFPERPAEFPQGGPAIERFDTTANCPMQAFYRKLATGQPVRIAVLGDSFIEGDILTADLREGLQQCFGGRGTGFAPAASPLTQFRRTIKTRSKGWSSYNIMQRKTTPAELLNDYLVSGIVCRPETGASTRWEMTAERERLDPADQAQFWFLSRTDSRIEVCLNDTLRRTFEVGASPALREIAVRLPEALHALEVRVLSGAAGVTGYGARFTGDCGVTVDNFSIRSNNGRALFQTSAALNSQLQELAAYDLIILQYGLNIMQQGVHGYTRYGQQIVEMITYVRHCFPGAAVLVLGVSERSVKTERGFEPMDALPAMLRQQRQSAEACGAAFWNTCEAMHADGGIERFVAMGWAGKDYTHINYAGGARIARRLCAALYEEAEAVRRRIEAETVQRQETEPLLDPAAIDSLLFDRLPVNRPLEHP